MDKLQWIKDLVQAEQQMEDSGVVDFSAGFDPETHIKEATLEFMQDLKAAFIDSASAFNQLKGSTLGNLKIYGISKTQVDFMLFRNGFKLIFSIHKPGIIYISFNSVPTRFLPGQQPSEEVRSEGEYLQARWAAFGELQWTYNEQTINMDYLVRYYLSRFVRESAK